MKEIWKPVKGFEGYYEVSNKGRVLRILKDGTTSLRLGNLDKKGFVRVTLSVDDLNKKKWCFMQRIVAQHFLENPEGLPLVIHKDGDKTNNRVSNLKWVEFRGKIPGNKK